MPKEDGVCVVVPLGQVGFQPIVYGMGIFVGNREIMTCAHVVKAALDAALDKEWQEWKTPARVQICFPLVDGYPCAQGTVNAKRWFPPGRSRYGEPSDIAVIELDDNAPAAAGPATILNHVVDASASVYGFRGAEVEGVWRSHPSGQWVEGKVMGPLPDQRVQFDGLRTTGARVERGFSGGGVYDPDQRAVVGMIVEAEKDWETKVAQFISALSLNRALGRPTPPQLQRRAGRARHGGTDKLREWERRYLEDQGGIWRFGGAPAAEEYDQIYRPEWYVELDGTSAGWYASADGLPVKEQALSGRAGAKASTDRTSNSDRIPLRKWSLAEACYHLIVDGDPGSGKTASVTRFLYDLSRVWIGAQGHGDSQPPVHRLRNKQGIVPIPIFIECESIGIDKSAVRVKDIIYGCFRNLEAADKAFLTRGLRDGRYFIVFDAVEKVKPTQHRLYFCHALSDFSEQWTNTRVIVTCRSSLCDDALRYLTGFVRVQMEPLSQPQVGDFVQGWLRRSSLNDEDKQKLLGAVDELDREPQRRAFVESPFFLTGVCSSFERLSGQVPRHVNMATLLEVWIASRCEYKDLEDEAENKHYELPRRSLEKIAYQTLKRLGNRQHLVIQDVLQHLYKGSSVTTYTQKRNAAQYLEHLSERTGLIFNVASSVRWRHDLFQDYLASYEVTRIHLEPRALLEFLGSKSYLNLAYESFIAFLPSALQRIHGSDNQVKVFLSLFLDLCRTAPREDKYPLWRLALSMLWEYHLMGDPETEWAYEQGGSGMQTCVQDDLYRFSVKQRVEILEHWGRLQREGNKAKPSAASEWVHIPRTEISLYSEHQSRLVGPFEIARQPVLVMEYQRFLENPEHLVERFWTHAPSNLPRETVKDVLPSEWRAQQRFPNRPVTFVNWYEAVAYCRWLTEAEGREQEEIIRLPTEHEWTAAASNAHPEKRYPWGDDPPKYGDQAQANWKGAQLGGPSPVGAFRPLRVAGGELDDIVGNVYQWSQGVASADEIAESTEIPLVGSSWDEMNLPVLQIKRVRYEKPASFRSDTIGFRCSRHLIVARSMS